jgi:lysozyme family protein
VSTAFLTAINRVLGIEGGYVNDPADPGGETNWGISKRSYPNLDIASLTRDDAIAIYERDFWSKIDGDTLPPGVGYQCLDFAVNSGVGTALRALQRAVGVADDGVFGPVSLAALKAQDAADTIMRFLAERLMFMSGLSNWSSFGKGWARRIATDLRYGAQDTP